METCEKRILIVDDEPDMCWALEHILKAKGLPSMNAYSGQEAIALIRGCNPRILFLDAKLPDMEGLDLARWVQQENPAVRIIMISGYFYRDDLAIQQALAEGLLAAFIAKPFCREEIYIAVKATTVPD